VFERGMGRRAWRAAKAARQQYKHDRVTQATRWEWQGTDEAELASSENYTKNTVGLNYAFPSVRGVARPLRDERVLHSKRRELQARWGPADWWGAQTASDGSAKENGSVAHGVVLLQPEVGAGTAAEEPGGGAGQPPPWLTRPARVVHAEGARACRVGTDGPTNQLAEATGLADALAIVPLAMGSVLYSDSESWLRLAEKAGDTRERRAHKWRVRVQWRSVLSQIVEQKGHQRDFRAMVERGAADGQQPQRDEGRGWTVTTGNRWRACCGSSTGGGSAWWGSSAAW
jgi:hypothetical protein